MRDQFNFEKSNLAFKYEASILASHLNYGNHLGYDSVLSLMQDARMFWLKSNNMTELSLQGDIGWMVSEVAVSYKSEGSFSNEIEILVYVTNSTKR